MWLLFLECQLEPWGGLATQPGLCDSVNAWKHRLGVSVQSRGAGLAPFKARPCKCASKCVLDEETVSHPPNPHFFRAQWTNFQSFIMWRSVGRMVFKSEARKQMSAATVYSHEKNNQSGKNVLQDEHKVAFSKLGGGMRIFTSLKPLMHNSYYRFETIIVPLLFQVFYHSVLYIFTMKR